MDNVSLPQSDRVNALHVDAVGLSYFSRKRETVALRDVSFSVRAGEFVSFVGPSGCGKSTLLSLIAGLHQPTSGRITLDSANVNAKVGYMLQQDYLLEWRNVLDNVLLGAEIQRMRDRTAEARATALLENYGLGRFLHHMPRQLSGGMRQRVALARTMLTNPDLILLDEPFSALDSQTRVGLADDMVAILKAERKTVILVTHDIAEALAMTDRIIVFTGRPGRIKEDYALSFAAPGSATLRPMERRSHPEFNRYFGTLWADLKEEEHVQES